MTWNPIRARLKGGADAIPGSRSQPTITTKPKTGTFCTRISPGCTNCYASSINKRFGNGLEYTVPNLEKVEFYLSEKILQEPLKAKKPCTIFVGDMFDLFHEAIEENLIAHVIRIICEAPQHTFQLLTKRAARMQELFSRYVSICPVGWPVKNMWLGVSVESQKYADERIPLLLQTPAAVRFLSVEPQLEAVNLDSEDVKGAHALGCGDSNHKDGEGMCRGVDWVICGGESGPGARPFNLAWAESLQAQCKAAGTAFFMKQIGSRPVHTYIGSERAYGGYNGHKKGGDMDSWPESLRVREFPA